MAKAEVMSKIWALHVPTQAGFAEASSFYESAMAGDKLPCGHPVDSPPRYQLLEWEPGGEPLGDFVAAGAWIVGQQQFLSRMSKLVHGYELGEVRYIEPLRKKGMRSPGGRRGPPRFELPYEGPPLAFISPTCTIGLLPESTVDVESTCPVCGSITYRAFRGIEKLSSRGRTPRTPNMGLFVRGQDVLGSTIFRPRFTGLTLCTDEARQAIESLKPTNLVFRDVGDAV